MRQISPTSKRVIIVGATSGIGRELALLYIRAGHRVGVTGRRRELLDSLQREFPGQVEIACYDVTGAAGDDAAGDDVAGDDVAGADVAGSIADTGIGVAGVDVAGAVGAAAAGGGAAAGEVAATGVSGADVTGGDVSGSDVSGATAAVRDDKSVDLTVNNNRRHLDALVERLGGLDLLVYSSGYGAVSDGSDAAADAAIDDETVAINVRGFLDTIHFGWEYFVARGHGHLATISSIASIRGNSRAPAYSATKAFQSNYFEGLYMKARRLGLEIAVTDIEPGFVATKMAQGEGLFWVAPVEKAALQIFRALEKRRRKVYITNRWRLIAWMMRWMPGMVYHRVA